MLPHPALFLLHSDGRLEAVGGRTLQGSRPQRHRAVRGPLAVRSPVSLPLEDPPHEDPRYQPGGSSMGHSLMGHHRPCDGQEESLHYALSGSVDI